MPESAKGVSITISVAKRARATFKLPSFKKGVWRYIYQNSKKGGLMAAPLRITKPAIRRAPAGSEAQGQSTELQNYMERLVKLIPGEIVGLYLIGNGIIPPNAKIAIVVWSIVCLILVVLVRSRVTGDRANKISPQWIAVAVSSISFIIWLYNMPGPFTAYNLVIPYVASLAVLLWTFVVPYLYKGD
jgi:hypothetical protein